MLEPLLQLRGEWRQAAAISVPSTAGEVADILDRAIDVLRDNRQLDEDSLVMAADVVCKAIPERPDVIAILRMRLNRAAHDYAIQTAPEDMGVVGGAGGAFASEEALAAALFSGADAESPGEAEEGPVRQEGGARLDSRALQRSISTRKPLWRRWLFPALRLLAIVGLIGATVLYVTRHGDLVKTFVVPTTSGSAPPSSAGVRQGTFSGRTATCEGGSPSADGASCNFPLTIGSGGALVVRVRWDSTGELGVTLLRSDGTEAAPIATGTDGRAVLSVPTAAPGTYSIRVSNPAPVTAPVHFTVTTGA